MILKDTKLMNLAKTARTFMFDAIVIQYSTILFLVGSCYGYLDVRDHQETAALLLLCTLCLQVATNFSLARERAVEIANRWGDELWHHVGRRYFCVVILAGGIMVAAGSTPQLVFSVALLSGLASVTVIIHSASQLRPDFAALRPFTFASAILLGVSFPVLSLAPVLGAAAFALMSGVLAARLFQLIGPKRGIGLKILPGAGSWPRLALWLAGIATAEYDRYLFAAKDSSAVGVQYGLLSTALILPLTVSIVIGPRLSARLLSLKIRKMIITAVAAYSCLLLLIASILLDRDQQIVFAGSAMKMVLLVACVDLYFYVMARNSNRLFAVNVLSTAVSSLGTVALLMNHEVIAALLRILAGLVLLLSLIVLCRRGIYYSEAHLAGEGPIL